MNVARLLRDCARESPAQAALVDRFRGRARQVTFAELDLAAARLASLFAASGLGAHDTALVFEKMSIELYVVLATIFRLGMTAMFVDASAGRAQLEHACRQVRPRAFIAASRAHLLRLTTRAVREIPIRFSIGLRVPGAVPIERAATQEPLELIAERGEDDPALVTFTSGTTGAPKAALRTHGFLLAQQQAVAANLAHASGEIELSTLPVFVLANLASKITSVLADADLRRPDAVRARPLVDQVVRHAADRAAASPAIFERLVEYCESRGIRLPGLRKIFTGGGPVSVRLLDRLARVAPHAKITAVYGSTEAEPIATLSRDQIEPADLAAMEEGRGLLAGWPVPGIQFRILKDHGNDQPGSCGAEAFDALCAAQGEPGEIAVAGPHVLGGYLGGCGDNENKFCVDGVRWHRTGDAGCLDDRGRLWLLGRLSARIDTPRGPAYPHGAEQMALRNEAVRRAAVVGIHGRRVLAVELAHRRARPDLEALLASLRPAGVDAVQLVDRMPVDGRHNAKVDYEALRAILERPR
jgi:acyl-CoA synthetase (AMP-forming)/AMP-acid ligase II